MSQAQPVVLCLFTGGTGSLETVSAQIGAMGSLPCRFRCVFSRAAAGVLGTGFANPLGPETCVAEGVDEGISAPRLVGECRIVVAPVLSQNTAVKAALGIRDSLASEILACAFMMAKPVVVARDSVAIEGAPPAYRRLLLDRLAALESFGAKVVPALDLSAQVGAILMGRRMGSRPAAPTGRWGPAGAGKRPWRRLVDLRAAVSWAEEHGESVAFPVAVGTIVTPLAADYLKEKRISIEFQSPEAGSREGEGGGGAC